MSKSDSKNRLAAALGLDADSLESLKGSAETLEALAAAAEALASSGESSAAPTASVADVAHIRELLMSPEPGHQEQAFAFLDALDDEEAWTAIVQGCRLDEQGRFHSDELKLTHSVFRAFCENPFADHTAVTSLDLGGPWTPAYKAREGWLRMGELECLAKLPSLTQLNLGGNKAWKVDLSALGRLTGLTELTLANTRADAVAVRDLVNLVRLDLRTCQSRDDAGEVCGWVGDTLAKLGAVEELDLDTDSERKLPDLSGLASLRSLTVSLMGSTAAARSSGARTDPRALVGLSSLQTLTIRGDMPRYGEPSLLDAVPSLTALTHLEVGDGNKRWVASAEAAAAEGSLADYQSTLAVFVGLRDVDEEALAPFADLKELDFSTDYDGLQPTGPPLTTLDGLRSLPLLETVGFKGCRILQDVSALADLEHLRSADLTWTDASCAGSGVYAGENLKALRQVLRIAVAVAEDDAKTLKGFHDVEELTLAKWRHEHLAGVRHLPNLTTLKVSSDTLTDPSGVQGLDKLTTLDLSQCSVLTELPKLPKSVTKLDLADCKALTKLAPLPEGVKELTLRNTGIDSFEALAGVKAADVVIGSNPNLASLAGLPTPATERTYVALQHLPALRSLEGIQVYEGISHFSASNCEQLTDIDALGSLETITRLALTDCPQLRGVDALTRLPHLGDTNARGDWDYLQLDAGVDGKGKWTSWGDWSGEVRPAPPGDPWQNVFRGVDKPVDYKPRDKGRLHKTQLYAYLDKIRLYMTLRDGDLEALERMEARVGYSSGEIRTRPLLEVEELDLGGTPLTTLAGLERFTKLTTLRLSESPELTDVRALVGLESLERLSLRGSGAVRPKPPSVTMHTREDVAAYQAKIERAAKKKKKKG